jgi:hypothetical protein
MHLVLALLKGNELESTSLHDVVPQALMQQPPSLAESPHAVMGLHAMICAF